MKGTGEREKEGGGGGGKERDGQKKGEAHNTR